MPEIAPDSYEQLANDVLTEITQSEYASDPADIPNEAARLSHYAALALRAAAKKLFPTAEQRREALQLPSQVFLNGMAYAAHELCMIASALSSSPIVGGESRGSDVHHEVPGG